MVLSPWIASLNHWPLSPLRDSVLKLYMLQFKTVYNYTFSRQPWQPALGISVYRNLSQNSLRISGHKKRRHTFDFWLVCFFAKASWVLNALVFTHRNSIGEHMTKK